ncbi:MAG: septation protein SepH, partial [Rhodoluna sp.]
MQDIRLVGNDGEYLNLETQSGDKFRLLLDDSLRAAVKRDSSVQLDAVSITPREIQDAVRAGASAEEVADKHSVPLDYVQKFALTVVDEIGHIIASAQAVRIAIAADRYSEATQLEFGEVISDRVSTIGGSKPLWGASKHEALPWHVSVTYTVDGADVVAVWSFDQRKLILSPENEAAVRFSSLDHNAAVATPKLRPLEPAVSEPIVVDIEPAAEVEIAPPTISVVPDIKPASAIEELVRSSVTETAPEATSSEPLTATADLLEALRKKRSATAVVEEPIAEATEVEESGAIDAKVDELIEEIEPAPVVAPAKKGR